jgi:hypothetical protein
MAFLNGGGNGNPVQPVDMHALREAASVNKYLKPDGKGNYVLSTQSEDPVDFFPGEVIVSFNDSTRTIEIVTKSCFSSSKTVLNYNDVANIGFVKKKAMIRGVIVTKELKVVEVTAKQNIRLDFSETRVIMALHKHFFGRDNPNYFAPNPDSLVVDF